MTKLKEVITKHLSNSGEPVFLFDIDGTLKETDKNKYPLRTNPAIPGLLYSLQNYGSVGVNTDQSAYEFNTFKQKLDGNLGKDLSTFTGPYLFEGGHVQVFKGGNLETDLQITVDKTTKDEILHIFLLAVAFNLNVEEWIELPELTTCLMLPYDQEQGIVTKIIYQKGPSINHPSYQGEYEVTLSWLTQLAVTANLLNSATLVEAGNGTLRIVKAGIDKGTAIEQLLTDGISPNQVMYSGDQINDLPAVRTVKESGGTVLLPSNSHPDLHFYADFISDLPESDGVLDMYMQILST